MDYLFEALSDDRFQKLCQTLLASQFPEIQCLPVNQPDGGRDAFFLERSYDGTRKKVVAFQVKFSRNANDSTERDAIDSLIRTESAKVERLKARGVTEYYLLTNVSGTSHLDVGSIDRTNAELTRAFGIPAYCWWRDDLERRVDLFGDVRWAYPEILKGSDVLPLLLNERGVEDQRRRDSAIKNYLMAQYDVDAELKFKQVELQNRLLNLFIDVPISLTSESLASREDRRALREVIVSTEEWHLIEGIRMAETDSRDFDGYGAATFFLRQQLSLKLALMVLEGAPGQGKSTITQYICQVHRMRLLNKTYDLGQLPQHHANLPVRLPLRVDLRDYATWVGGKNPFGVAGNRPLPHGTSPSLETFLAAQIADASGGLEFNVSDLAEVLRVSHALIVLDGFDEVADVPIRRTIVQQITQASKRLIEHSKSIQIIVTSRPSAFANSPGFSLQEWAHLELKSLTQYGIHTYADKWMRAKGMQSRQQDEFREILSNRLGQPHIRDLARNPMQLTILLSLINTKGLSLPDKRTALYDSYVDLFFSREAEKSIVVRDYRDLLIALHRHLAWVLQTEAEKGKGNGSIEVIRLKTVLRDFMIDEGHDSSLVDILFTGMVERVVALVSRVIGTYEFEVQPLREYFCARYLYETAPYSPVGSERKGSKPERFDAISRNFYWLNVARFYAGCYSTGELSSLVDGIEFLSSEEPYSLVSHPRRMAAMLLSDWVFTQQPLVVRRVVDFLLREPGFTTFVAVMAQTTDFNLPEGCGRKQIADALEDKLTNNQGRRPDLAVARLLQRHSDVESRMTFWRSLEPEPGVMSDGWCSIGSALALWPVIPRDHALELWSRHGKPAARALAMERRSDVLGANADLLEALLEALLDGEVTQPWPYLNRENPGDVPELAWALTVFSQYYLSAIFSSLPESMNLIGALGHYVPFSDSAALSELPPNISTRVAGIIQILSVAARKSFDEPVSTWKTELGPWHQIVDAGISATGERWIWRRLAAIAAGITSQKERGGGSSNLWGSADQLCARTRYCRRASPQWWRNTLLTAPDFEAKLFALALLLTWGTERTVTVLRPDLVDHLEDLSTEDWRKLVSMCGEIWSSARSKMPTIKAPSFSRQKLEGADRLVALLGKRAEASMRHSFYPILKSYDGDDRTILGFLAEAALLAALEKAEMWGDALVASRRAFAADCFVDPIPVRRARATSKMTLDAARLIAREPMRYPLKMLELADERLTANAGRSVKKVIGVAEAEGWFSSPV